MLNLIESIIADMNAIIQVYEPIQESLTEIEKFELNKLKRCNRILTQYKPINQKTINDGNPENRFITVA